VQGDSGVFRRPVVCTAPDDGQGVPIGREARHRGVEHRIVEGTGVGTPCCRWDCPQLHEASLVAKTLYQRRPSTVSTAVAGLAGSIAAWVTASSCWLPTGSLPRRTDDGSDRRPVGHQGLGISIAVGGSMPGKKTSKITRMSRGSLRACGSRRSAAGRDAAVELGRVLLDGFGGDQTTLRGAEHIGA